MAKRLPDIQVMIPYKTLQELLGASAEVELLRKENGKMRDEVSALRRQFTELMEKFKELQ